MPEPKRTTRPATFFDQVKAALTHYAAPHWLGEHSPLAAPYFLGAALQGATPAASTRGQALIAVLEQTLAALWGGPLPDDGPAMLQAVAAEAAEQGQGSRYDCLILELNYRKRSFRPAPKSQAEIYNDILHISRPTHDRHLHDAVARLGAHLLHRLRPAIRPEQPTLTTHLVGRQAILAQLLTHLQAGKSVSLTGAGGVGKTSLAVAVTEQWHSPATFWFTFRPTFNDQLESLLFALGHFLHSQGAPTLWHQLVADGGRLKDSSLALGLARSDLATLTHQPLLCFDELDFLRPLTLEQPNPKHVQLLEFLDSLRGHAPLLLIGQRAFWESDQIYTLEALDLTQLALLLDNLTIPATDEDVARLHAYTGGNPRLAELCAALYWASPQEPFSVVLDQLPQSAALLPLWHRLERRLPAAERRFLHTLAVFRTPAPADAWADEVENDGALHQLIQRRLVRPDEQGGVTLLPALRQVIYDDLAVEDREQYHLQAAVIRAERGEYTAAAYHLHQGKQAETAVALWYAQRRGEINRGQGAAALAIFEQISQRQLTKPRAQELALLRGELYELTGQPAKVVTTLAQQEWLPANAQTIDAQILWGNALRQQGQGEAALAKFREGLTLHHKLLHQGTQLYTLRGLISLHQRDMQQARQEVARARLQVEYLQGALHDLGGDYDRSLAHYQAALTIAHELNDASDIADVQHHLALLRGRQQGLAAAAEDYEQAMRHYEQSGDRYRLEIVRSNLANTQIQSRHFAEAVTAAGKALRFFQSIGNSVRIAQNASNLAEALTELDRLAEAEGYARLVLEQEEPHSHPYALYTLGTIQRKRGQLTEAELYYTQARQVAEMNEDHYLLAYAWEALGQIYKTSGKIAAAQAAIRQAETDFQKLGIAEKVTEIAALRQELDALDSNVEA